MLSLGAINLNFSYVNISSKSSYSEVYKKYETGIKNQDIFSQEYTKLVGGLKDKRVSSKPSLPLTQAVPSVSTISTYGSTC